MQSIYFLQVQEEQVGTRLDKFVYVSIKTFTRSRIQDLISKGCILVNNELQSKNYKTKLHDSVEVKIPVITTLEETKPENIPINIIYEDDDIVVINKEKGMVVHPAAGNWNGTLVNALLFHCKGHLSDINGVIRPGIVHRIDKDTSGILVIAKNNAAHLFLANQVKKHLFFREYEAIVHGNLKKLSGEINLPIGRDPKDRKKFTVTQKNSKPAVTKYCVTKQYKNYCHVKLMLQTGRTHQIRVHMSYLNHPIAGDCIYGSKIMPPSERKLNGQCLHARCLGFVHPTSNNFLTFKSNLPEYFLNFLTVLNNSNTNNFP